MDQQLLEYYNRELLYIRELGGEFAREYPKIAGRLGLDGFECADPYVERLLEGFAFLAARVHLKIDSEFPKFTDHLLEMVYPQYLSPIPSMAVVQFSPDPQEGSLAEGYELPRHSSIRSMLGPGDQTACEYRTCHDITLWPIQLTEASYVSRDAVASRLPSKLQDAKAVLRIRLATTANATFDQLPMDRLPIFLRGKDVRSFRLYEQLFADAKAVLVSPVQSASTTASPFMIDDAIQSVGFDEHQAMLPNCPRSFDGYRLINEFFAFQQRFMFFELSNLRSTLAKCRTSEIEILIPLRRLEASLENIVDQDNFGLFCTPVINLFPMRADRIHLKDSEVEFHIVPDRTRPMDFEVHSVEQVTGYDANLEASTEFSPFYRMVDREASGNIDRKTYYSLRRTFRQLSTRQKRKGPRTSYVGSEVYLSLVDTQNAPVPPSLGQLDLKIFCTNRDLPLVMPIGKMQTDFTLEDGAPIKSIRCVAGPTEPKPSFASLSGDRSWRLINHLSLNYLSVVDSDGKGAAALRELLFLYHDALELETTRQANGILSVKSQPIVRRLSRSGPLSFGRGIEITLECDDTLMEGSSSFLLGSVLSRFFAKYVSINSFTQTVLRTQDRGEVMRWQPNLGSRQIL